LTTPVPVVAGVHVAKVDGDAWNGRAEIDSQGRYKLQLTFADEAGKKGRGSDYVRKIEPYVGPSQTGLHFPLVAGTEVLVGYMNGDIDRPVVFGAVHNPDMKGVVTSDAHLFNRIKSQSGALLEIYDGPV
jgi:type VI secretion system secreted protein VgrG